MKLSLPNFSRFVFAGSEKAGLVERWVFAIGLACCLLGLVGLLRWGPSDPVEKIRVDAAYKGLTAGDVWPYLQEVFGQDLLAVDLPTLSKNLERHPWIEKVTLRRVWPDSLVVEVTEPSPFARWTGLRGEQGFVTQQGEALEAAGAEGLALAYEGAGEQANEFVDWQEQVKNTLAGSDWQLKALARNDFGQWRVYVDSQDGDLHLELRLGSEWNVSRWQRFQLAWARGLEERKNEIAYVDLRYSGGLAVGWKGQQAAAVNTQNFDLSLWAKAPLGV